MRNIRFLSLLALIACLARASDYRPPATSDRYKKVVESWIGADINNLIEVWGPPSSTYDMPNKQRMFTWSNIKIGPSVTTGSSFAQASNPFGTAMGFGLANAVTVTPMWDCTTTFTTSPEGKILKWL